MTQKKEGTPAVDVPSFILPITSRSRDKSIRAAARIKKVLRSQNTPAGGTVVPQQVLRCDAAHAVQNIVRTVCVVLHFRARGAAAQHEHGVQTGLDAGNDVGVHAVADHDRLVRMYAEQAQTGAHHERIGLADVVRGLAGRQLDRRDERTARRDDALLGRAGQVGVGRDEARAC